MTKPSDEVRANRVVIVGEKGREEILLEGSRDGRPPGICFLAEGGEVLSIQVESGRPQVQFMRVSGSVACFLEIGALDALVDPGEATAPREVAGGEEGFMLSLSDGEGRPRLFVWPPRKGGDALVEAFDAEGRPAWSMGQRP